MAARLPWRWPIRLPAALARLAHSRRAVAVVEFAIALPVLIALYMLAFVMSDMIACSRKVTITARALTDLATRSAYLSTNSSNAAYIGTLMAAAQQVLAPYAASNAVITLSQVQVVDSTHVIVVWSQSYSGSTLSSGYTAGTSITTTSGLIPSLLLPSGSTKQSICTTATSLTGDGGSLIYGEVRYAYTPSFWYGSASTITFYQPIIMSPRLSASIALVTS